MSVRPEQRHKRRRPCAICGGGDDDPRGHEKRCHGYVSDDGWVHCSRDELAGSIDQGTDLTYAHRPNGPCKCGQTHGEALSGAMPSNDIEALYDYRDERGTLLFQVVRKHPKRFIQRRPDGAGWLWQTNGVRRVLYRLPELLASDKAKTVYLVEGEKDADNLAKRGYVATTNPGGAGKWRFVADDAKKALAGRSVVIVADADAPGRLHARDVAEALRSTVKSVRVVEVPAPQKDVTEFLEAGGALDGWLKESEPEPTESAARSLAPEIPFDDLWTTEPEAELIIPGLGIGPGPVHTVIGTFYTGKTLFMMSLGLSVASGKDVFGMWRVRRGKWIHFDYEMGRRHIKRYIQRLAVGMGIDPDDLRHRVSIRTLPLLNLTTEGASELYAEIFDGASLVTIDPLRSAARGADENKSEFREHLDLIASVSESTRCPVMLLHHAGKPSEGSERRHTGRGTSAIDDAAQTKFVLSAKEKGAPILVTHEKSRELTKPLDNFYLEIDNSNPKGVRLIHRFPEEVDDSALDEVEKIKPTILRLVQKASRPLRSANDIYARSGLRREVCLTAIRELMEGGQLAQPDGPHGCIRVVPKMGTHSKNEPSYANR